MNVLVRLGVAAVAIGLCAVAGCGSSTTSTAPPGPSTSPPTTRAAAEVRGVPVPSATCPTFGSNVAATAPVAVAEVRSVVVCPTASPGPTSGPVTLAAADPRGVALLAALSAPDVPKPPGQVVCALYADVTQVVLATTVSGTWQLHVPVDGCGHYLGRALQAIRAARS